MNKAHYIITFLFIFCTTIWSDENISPTLQLTTNQSLNLTALSLQKPRENTSDNTTPTIIISANTNTAKIGEEVIFDASESSDPDNLPLTFVWTQITGTNADISDFNSANLIFNAPAVPSIGEVLIFELTVSSNNGNQSNTVSVTVIDPEGNQLPIANAGSDQVVLYSDNVFLDGSSSSDDEGIDSYLWGVIAGEQVVLTNNTGPNPFYSAPSAGDNTTLQLTITDAFGLSSSDEVTIFYTQASNTSSDNVDTSDEEFIPLSGTRFPQSGNDAGGCLLKSF